MATILPNSIDPVAAAKILAEIAKGRENIAAAQANIQSNQAALTGYAESIAANKLVIIEAQAIIAKNNVEIADETLPDDRRLALEANNAANLAAIAEATANIATNNQSIATAQNNIALSQTNLYENELIIDENAARYKEYTGIDVSVPDSATLPNLSPTGPAYDDDGNLMPGWELDENNNPVNVGFGTPINSPDTLTPVGMAYDDEGNLMPGWELDENNNPVNVGFGTPVTSPVNIDPSQGPAYDDEGNLLPGWSLNENNDPVWIGGDYIEPTLDGTGQTQPEVPSTPVDLSQADIAAHGPAYDDNGNLMPGWSLDEDGNPRWIGGDFVEPSTQASADASREENAAAVVSGTEDAQKKATEQDIANFQQNSDWRVKLSLAPKSNYLYNAENAGILTPLKATSGVVFPYSPQIQMTYTANYVPSDITHTNYKFYQYQNSEVGQIQISADFTAQDTQEANYMLAVIHFFKSVTKMFYGQDNNPPNGVPPPLCYLSGYGAYQFDNHPLVISSFSYSLPNDVDYIRAGGVTQQAGVNLSAYQYKVNTYIPSLLRLSSSGLNPGGLNNEPKFTNLSNKEATYVPTKLTMSLTCIPIVTRRDVSNNFSLGKYATGELLRGSRRQGGGIW